MLLRLDMAQIQSISCNLKSKTAVADSMSRRVGMVIYQHAITSYGKYKVGGDRTG